MRSSSRPQLPVLAATCVALSIVAALVAVGPSAPAGAEPSVEERWSSVPGVGIVDLAATASGLYAADGAGSRLLRIAADGSATVAADLSLHTPSALEPDRDGGVLVVSFASYSVLRIRPDGSSLTWTVPRGVFIDAVVPLPDGSVLVFGEGSRTVTRLGPDGAVDPFALDLGFSPTAVHAVGTSTGDVYFTDSSTRSVYRLSEGGVSPMPRGAAAPASVPVALHSGGGGVVVAWSDGLIERLDPDGSSAAVLSPDAGMAPLGDVAVDARGDVFLTTRSRGLIERAADGSLVQLGSTTGRTVVAAPDGAVYAVGDSGRSITRIHPAAGAAPTLGYGATITGVAGLPLAVAPSRVASDAATYAVTRGALPPGVGLTPTGAIAGTPTSAGEYRAQITVSSAGGRSSVDVVIRIRGDRSGTY
ncbi:putative Ig domain-containing protein [Cnuibacter physcomitrellae]|uniref:putative Ig domain-containing protein n=1 Tax=Cnuibacter physcomitrellae TaxID=1619308 RepID=UPI0021757940|nr:putative Ig domain-containing protein [Cnuibacter physcomitrellae]MCS5496864.1 putative Ig domain-containing protein [Cnuibacter physcomitrellae]